MVIGESVGQGIIKCMLEYIGSQQNNMIDLSPLYDYCAKKVKFKPDNFTDVTLKSYIQDVEEKYLINQRKLNKSCHPMIVSSLQGAASDYMKKMFANFGFPSLFVPELQQAISPDFETTLIPSLLLGGNLTFKYCRQTADLKKSKLMICTDPIGECMAIAEYINEWVYYDSHQISLLLLDFLYQ